MQINTKKEVSCKAVEPLFNAFNTKNLDENLLLVDIPYEKSYLKNSHERIEWSVWCKLVENTRPFFTYSEFEVMGENVIKSGSYIIGMFFGFFLFSTNKLARLLNKQVFKLVGSTFSCIKQRTEYLAKNKIRVTGFLEEGYDFCPEFWYISKGAWHQSALLIGHKDVNVNLSLQNREAIFEVSWKSEGIGFKFRKAFRWLFNIREAFIELTESHETLLNQYQDLDESKKLLQKQTTQLKVAYEISTSIRQSLNISDTLKAIADSFVKEAGFTAVYIELEKDLEGNNFKKKFQAGAIKNFTPPSHKEIIINNKKIGDVLAFFHREKDIREVNELLDYITPVINIAIHDALTLREVTNYKDNLERMVSDRTIELQKARDELSQTNELLKKSQQVQSRFFTNISHEFRTPLTLILGPSKQLSNESSDEKTKTKAELIHRSASKLNRLVDELLDISKIEAGEMKLKACPVNIVALVSELAFSFHSFAERKKIEFNFNCEENEIITYLDKDKTDKILTNVLSNAFKFTPEGGKVEIEMLKDESQVQVIVSDTGMGIPRDKIDKIFDRFFQVDGSHTREQEGTGIGLALTKELVDLHKGKIEVESEEGKGSTFRLIFPLGKDHLKPEEICEEEKEKEKLVPELDEFLEKKVEHKAGVEFSDKPTLLIVEDNPDVRNYISLILENQYRIFEAKDGEEGLNKSFECIPDLIISDIMMPKLDGFQMCSKLKTDSRTSHIPIIMLTAKATMNDKINGLEIGADDYIMKPFEATELKARIKNLLAQRKRLHEHFRKYGLVEIEEKNITPVDQKFLQKALAVINEHISDTSFGVEKLADDMALSRTLLLKKIDALIGEKPVELIRRIRLNKAAKLIEKDHGNISEIALEVGFNNPSYFAEAFKKQFGVSPSQYHQNK